jgi:4-carboxymuconolactone decarboxylase
MAPLPDPRPHLDAATLEEIKRMAAVRSHSDGRVELARVYVAMFNNAGVARQVGALGEHLRFEGSLPDRLRETAILRYAARTGFEYEWAHHVRPAGLAGLSDDTIDALAAPEVPPGLDRLERAVVEAVDHIVARVEIPDSVQRTLTDHIGTAGVVELVALCGLYGMMGYMTTAFAVDPEPGLPALPRPAVERPTS